MYYDEDEEFSYNTLVDEYGSQEETLVEELIWRNSCVMSYLFTAHAYNNKDLDNDAANC